MTKKRAMSYALLLAGSLSLPIAAAPPSIARPAGMGAAAFALSSTAFTNGGTIPKVHECTTDGRNDPRQKNESPPLAWSGAPAAAKSYAIVMRDLDNQNLIHWVIYDIPVSATSLPQNVEHVYQPATPAGARQVYYRGSAKLFGYQGPCSPSTVNTYEFVVHALNRQSLTELTESSSTQTAARAITNASVGSAKITGES
ncbi:YbhB/YbcL family Raf kinase inhibitor-like protein [Actinomadura roseirufa]|uniref:YbhB/YbcL family Raf kinase inhibitor-like protein n=1 Tax=Actinomadura roseirufa TaxID=2094049 RepID=UPI001A954DD2|nr:YbhB/YbcL family Raf kinase inhibitor-like protein [Actinomadura roseirufa]